MRVDDFVCPGSSLGLKTKQTGFSHRRCRVSPSLGRALLDLSFSQKQTGKASTGVSSVSATQWPFHRL